MNLILSKEGFLSNGDGLISKDFQYAIKSARLYI
jgi:hypothetical protein